MNVFSMPLLVFAAVSALLATSDRPLSALKRIDPDLATQWQITVPAGRDPLVAFLGDRIALADAGSPDLKIVGLDGKLLASLSVEPGLTRLEASTPGAHLLATSRVNEDVLHHSLRDHNGRELWSAPLDRGLHFSPSGRFLLATWDFLDSGQTPAVLHVASGKIAWEDSTHPPYWHLAASANDRLAFYQRGSLKLFDLPTGSLLWETEIPAEPNDLGKVFISQRGERVVVQTHVIADNVLKPLTRVYDGNGTLVRESLAESLSGQSNGGIVKAISTDGELLAIGDLDHLAIVRTDEDVELWRSTERVHCCVATFTSDLLAFDHGGGTRLFQLEAPGVVVEDLTLDASLAIAPAGDSASAYVAYVTRRDAGGLTISAVTIDPQSGLRRRR